MDQDQAWEALERSINKLNAALIARSSKKNVPRDVWDAAEEAEQARQAWVAAAMPRDLWTSSQVEYCVEEFPDMLAEMDADTLRLVCRDLWASNAINAKVRAMDHV